jgi:HAD superfamily hydrolase (TIGR01662 family)
MTGRFVVIFFDLGGTLIYDKDLWTPILRDADVALRKSLEISGYPLDPDAYGDFETLFELYYHRRRDTHQEETTIQLLRELMGSQGTSPPTPVLRSAMEAMYAVTQENWYVESDTRVTLEEMKSHGYKLGLISNVSDDENVQVLVDKAKIRKYFDLILSSAACGVRKPDPGIFKIALEHFKVPPERTMMVGDTLAADILGANQMGIYSIWINRRAAEPEEGELQIQPDAVISALHDLPALLNEISG